jgi:two-component system, NarL family, invasion response regulator UvrY
MPIDVLLVDDHKVVREGYRRLLERDSALSIVGEASTAEAAYQAFCEFRPEVVVLDIAMPGASGVNAMRHMLARDRAARILVCSMYEDPIYVERSLENGASGYVTKAAAAEVLVAAIKAVSRGERYLSHDAASALARWQGRGRNALASLNSRELEVLRQLVRGTSLVEIACAMNLSEKTVANYQTLIRQKLGARNAAQLVRAATRLGLDGGDSA